jgi:carbonic anhydrase
MDSPRDWDDLEKRYLAAHQGLRESIIDWCRFMNQSSCTEANLEFLAPYWNAQCQIQTNASEP